jgi:potassium-transporting ATPase KdpC subunit
LTATPTICRSQRCAPLVDRVKGGVEAWRVLTGDGPVPADAVTASAAGLNQDVSPETALGQVAAVAKARSMVDFRG